ncbi:MAG: aminomethyl-transferring glycine dehydrogenase subunit GcvPA [Candidatus Omnitrophica bacterium]|nr:aminomethyl-transferring glycine dehydrogenase subunit GcvPA [Candidatus Omnitrophota bacterium]
MEYIPNTAEDRRQILRTIGVDSLEALLQKIPKRLPKARLSVPAGLSEPELTRHLEALAGKNRTTATHLSFLGAGVYEHFIPSVVRYFFSRGEFLTAYTPYQAEASQGALQAMYEFQTLICDLTGMDVANASLYDGSTSMSEAALLALRETQRSKLVVSSTVHPEYVQVLRTYLKRTESNIIELPIAGGVTSVSEARRAIDSTTAAVIVQMPNFYGCLEPVAELAGLAHAQGALFIVVVHPVSLGVLKAPGEYGADIVVGEGQPLGLPPMYGGPYLGLFACREKLLRKIPGRIVGMTQDSRGRRGFTLTLQTREQHIRRSKATSNICTNEGMCALVAWVYLSALGKEGFQQLALQNVAKSHYAFEKLTQIPGIAPLFQAPFFNEFALKLPCDAAALNERLFARGFLGGVDLGRFSAQGKQQWLVCVTETKAKAEIDAFTAAVRESLS